MCSGILNYYVHELCWHRLTAAPPVIHTICARAATFGYGYSCQEPDWEISCIYRDGPCRHCLDRGLWVWGVDEHGRGGWSEVDGEVRELARAT